MSQEELKTQTHKPQAHKPQAKDIKDGVDTIVSQWLAAGVTDDLQPMEVFGRLARIHKHIETEILRCHGEFGLRQGEFDVLATLRRSGEPYTLTPGQLHQSMMLTSGAMTSRLDKLEQKAHLPQSLYRRPSGGECTAYCRRQGQGRGRTAGPYGGSAAVA